MNVPTSKKYSGKGRKHLLDALKSKKKQGSQVECYMLLGHVLKIFFMESSGMYTFEDLEG